MTNQLPDNLAQALTAYNDPVAVLTWIGKGSDRNADLVAKVPAQDIEGFRGAAVRYQWELGLFASGPVLCLALDILDILRNPFGIETFLNVARAGDLALAQQLVEQARLTLHFYDMNLGYHFSKQTRHRRKQRQELADLVRQALDHLETCEQPDWYAARQEFFKTRQRK
jgi:hypothetical protein